MAEVNEPLSGVTFGFYDSLEGDRKYNARDFGSIFDGVVRDGVFQNIGDMFAVSATDPASMEIIVGTGRAWFDGTWTLNEAKGRLRVPDPSMINNRIDVVVLETDRRTDGRTNSIKIVAGPESAGPLAPAIRPELVKSDYVNQYALAYINVPAAVSAITDGDITNVIGFAEEGTPFVTGILEVNSVDYIYKQWQNYFNKWFDHIRDELNENQAGRLWNQIDTFIDLPSGTLPVGQSQLVIEDRRIIDKSLVDIYTSIYGVVPEKVEIVPGDLANDIPGKIIMEFDEQESDMFVKVRCWYNYFQPDEPSTF